MMQAHCNKQQQNNARAEDVHLTGNDMEKNFANVTERRFYIPRQSGNSRILHLKNVGQLFISHYEYQHDFKRMVKISCIKFSMRHPAYTNGRRHEHDCTQNTTHHKFEVELP